MQYSSSAWDPYTQKCINQLEMVQRRAARLVKNYYSIEASVSAMIQGLKWPSLSSVRKRNRLILLYKSLNDLNAINGNDFVKFSESKTRKKHPYIISRLGARTDCYKFSFFPRTVVEWNDLPEHVVLVNCFKSRLEAHLFAD